MGDIKQERFPYRGAVPYLLLILTAAGALTPLAAHDFWIEPAAFFPQPGDIVGVRLRVGQDFIGDPVPRNPALVKQFFVEDPAGRAPLPGRSGSDPAGLLRVARPGLLIIGYLSSPSPVELPAEKFTPYLKEEGLESIVALRAKRNAAGAPGRETFSRCAKSLLVSGGAPRSSAIDRPLGLTLELVAGRAVTAFRAGEDFPVRLIYEGRPLAGALVVAMNRRNPSEKQSARTGKDGSVRFRLRQDGMWLIKAVHMIPAPAGSGADWASYWASLTFEARQ